jgi:diadenosine hexaphosphate hydrolase (ATP-forming)
VPQAGAVVLVRDKVALRLTQDDTWVLPKGHIEAGETPEQAATREVAEEMGLSGRLGPMVGELRFVQRQRQRQVTYYLFHAGRPLPSWDEHLGHDTFLFSPREAVERLTHPDARALLTRALEQARGGDDR